MKNRDKSLRELLAVRWLAVAFAALTAATAVSCSHETDITEPLKTKPQPISFNPYVGLTTKTAEATKAGQAIQTDVDNDHLDAFRVSAFGNNNYYFTAVDFTKDSSNEWCSTPVWYWPAFNLTFYAYNVPAGFSTTVVPTWDATKGEEKATLFVTPADDIEEQEDLVGAKTENTTPTEDAVSLTFNHYLTKLSLKASNSSSVYTVKVDGMKIANIAGDGTYNIGNNSTVATNGKVNTALSSDYEASFTPVTLGTTASNLAGGQKWYLIPQAATAWDPKNDNGNSNHGTYLALKVLITSQGGANVYPQSGTETAWMAVPIPTQLTLTQGHHYIVTLDFFGNSGAGYGDPEEDGTLKGKAIVKGKISFSVNVNQMENISEIEIKL